MVPEQVEAGEAEPGHDGNGDRPPPTAEQGEHRHGGERVGGGIGLARPGLVPPRVHRGGDADGHDHEEVRHERRRSTGETAAEPFDPLHRSHDRHHVGAVVRGPDARAASPMRG